MRCDVKRLNGYGTLDGLALPRAIERKKETGTRGTNSSRSDVKRLNGYGTLDGLTLPRTIERKKETGTRGTNSKVSGNDHRCDDTALPEEWCPRRRAAREKIEARERERERV